MTIIKKFTTGLLLLAFLSSPTFACDKGNWVVGSIYQGSWSDGIGNILKIRKFDAKKCTLTVYYEAVGYHDSTYTAKIGADKSLTFDRKSNVTVRYTPTDSQSPYGKLDGVYDVGNANDKLKLRKTYSP